MSLFWIKDIMLQSDTIKEEKNEQLITILFDDVLM